MVVDYSGEDIKLADYRGKPAILAFYPPNWSPVCGNQMVLYLNEVLLFEEHHAQLLGISVDGRWGHRAFADDHNLNFPLMSGFEPKGEVAKKYGVYDPQAGYCERGSMPRGSFGGVASLHQASIRELMAFYLH